jgi:hypothetical protein
MSVEIGEETGEQRLELVDAEVEAGECWLEAGLQVIVVHQSTNDCLLVAISATKALDEEHIPDKNTKCLCFAHMHQKRSNNKAKTLTVSNFRVVQTEAFQHAREHLLSISFGVLEHVDIRPASSDIFTDYAFVWT